MLETARLRLVPVTVELARAELADRPRFAAALNATVPAEWPTEMLAGALPFFLQRLEAAPKQAGWWTWYGLLDGEGAAAPVLVASAGFLGPPREGAVELGYSVLPAFQGRGYATEMARALVGWAFAQAGVRRIVADVLPDNTPSVRLLRTLGFTEVGAGAEPGYVRYALLSPAPGG
jgi:ribosomal-protein-alanine N-acetyltransferase